jgi:hypothetical protein
MHFATVWRIGVDAQCRTAATASDDKTVRLWSLPDFVRTLEAQAGGIYAKVQSKLLVDHDASRAKVLEGLVWLEKETTSRDVATIFLAGHGITDEKGVFWFLPADVAAQSLRATAIYRRTI